MSYDPLDSGSDPFKPPTISTIVGCIHCGETYDSYQIEWRVETDDKGRSHGFWCCPMEGCDGRGFGFDILPVDPDYRDENGNRMWVGDEEDEEEEEVEDFDDEANMSRGSETDANKSSNGDGESMPW